jgi:hypothetical protein
VATAVNCVMKQAATRTGGKRLPMNGSGEGSVSFYFRRKSERAAALRIQRFCILRARSLRC